MDAPRKARRIRLEVGRSRSRAWAWCESILRKHPSHSVRQDASLEVHCLEFDDVDEFAGYFDIVRSWKMVAVYVSGKLLDKVGVFDMLFRERVRQQEIDALTKSLKETNRRNWEKGADVRFRIQPDENPDK